MDQIGFPFWDKSLIYSNGKSSGNLLNSETDDSLSIVLVPFVRDSQNVVNAILRVTFSPADTTFRYICDWQYSDSVMTGLSGRSLSLLLMQANNSVFGNKTYRILDSAAFGGLGSSIKFVRPTLDSIGRHTLTSQGKQSLLEVVYTITVCYSYWVPVNQGQVVGCAPGPDCPFYNHETSCETISWTEFEYDGGGGGTGSNPGEGGSGGGSGSGSTPPECEGGAFGRNSQYVNPCPPGWIPIDDDPAPQDDPCDKAEPLTTDNEFIAAFSALKNNTGLPYETGYINFNSGVLSYLDNAGADPEDGELKFTVYEPINGYIHCHTNGLLKIFSVGDLLTIYKLLVGNMISSTNFTLGLTVPGGATYLLTLDDREKFVTFANNYFEPDGLFDRADLEKRYTRGHKVHQASNSTEAEYRFLKFLEGLEMGVSVLKANSTLTAYSKLSAGPNGSVIETVCP